MDRVEDAVIGRLFVLCVAAHIMGFAGAVHGYAYEKMIVPEKFAPFFIYLQTVCLDGIGDTHSVAVKALLKFYCFLIKRKTAQGGFSALEGKADIRLRLKECFFNDIFQCVLGHHAVGRLLPLGCLIAVETVVTVHAALAG